jgi:hypothetical protein
VIEIRDPGLAPELHGMLDEQQAKIDAVKGYAAQVEAARRAWENRSRERFRPIRDALAAMCSGEDRCMYCEDSEADEIEHALPRSFFPDRTFRWPNFLFACGPCNGKKSNRFAVISRAARSFVEVKRLPRGAVTPPEEGLAMLIDPRREDPMRSLILDLRFPFHYAPRHERGCLARARAAYTIEVLQMNREPRPRRRQRAYGEYLARLKEYVVETDAGARERLSRWIQTNHHPTVWREMQRQHGRIDELRALFERAPEALSWVAA